MRRALHVAAALRRGLALAWLALAAVPGAVPGTGTAFAQGAADDAPPAVPQGAAAAPARRPASGRAPLPAANFVVEWRVQPLAVGAARGGVVITSGSAAVGGASGYGPGAVVVGTARAAVPQAVRVANGKEGAIRFDNAQSHTVYDMSYSATSSSQSAAAASGNSGVSGAQSRSRSSEQGAAGHEVFVHRVDGMRVTPRWTRGDTLELDVQLMHAAPAGVSGMSGADSRASRGFDFHSTVQLSFDEWQGVASVGDGDEELQVRVSWR